MSRRTERVNSMVRSELAKLLLQEVSDPALKDITITDVEASEGLGHAKVYFSRSHFQPSVVKSVEVKKGLKRATPFLRGRLAKSLSLRTVPELSFEEDTHNDELNRVMGLLNSVKNEGTPLQ